MNRDDASNLLRNLLERIEQGSDGKFRLGGVITPQELSALGALIDGYMSGESKGPARDYGNESPTEATTSREVTLNLRAVEMAPASINARLCLDFGTAMSKATLVVDESEQGFEEIRVLRLGIPGDQEEIDEVMLISSVFIDQAGLLWFGKAALDRAQLVDDASTHTRIDNIKRWLSEGNLDTAVEGIHNPTSLSVTYADLILAYLSFFTWAVNRACDLEAGLDIPANVIRRFALPCFPTRQSTAVAGSLRQMLGEAQILADSFGDEIANGLSLQEFVSTAAALRSDQRRYSFVDQEISEPLGVAGSLISWKAPIDALALVIDVGAGTSDFSLYRLAMLADEAGTVDVTTAVAAQVEGSSFGITEAGNHLDHLLKAHILRRAGIDSSHLSFRIISYDIERDIREWKETLFSQGSVLISLREGDPFEVIQSEFEAEEAVEKFSGSLQSTVNRVLASVDQSWIDRVRRSRTGQITVVLTGGGAKLPMVQALASTAATVRGVDVPLALAIPFPGWLSEDYPELEESYPRIAVSLGGARKNVVNSIGLVNATAGDVGGHILGAFPTRGDQG